MKALFVAHTAAPSGAELAAVRLACALRDLPADDAEVVPAVVFTESGPMVAAARARGIETAVLPGAFDSRAMTIEGRSLRSLAAGCVGLARLGWALGAHARGNADMLIAESTKALLMGAVAAPRARIPLIWHVHDRIDADYFGRPLAAAIRLLGRAVASGYLANSRATLSTLLTWRIPALVAYPGIEPQPRQAQPRQAQRAPEHTVVTMVGRLTPWKGQHVLLRALAALPTRPAAVYLVGGAHFGEESYRDELLALAAEFDLPVTFTGHVDDPRPYLLRADIAVHCSTLPEPFGQVVVEAMAAGCAVIAARPGGPTEILDPEVHGVLVDADNRDQLATALTRLIGDPDLRTRLAEAGRIRASRFEIACTAREVAEFLSGFH